MTAIGDRKCWKTSAAIWLSPAERPITGWSAAGVGVRIAAGLARSYFIGATTAEGTTSAVCILPAGIEEGQSIELADREFRLLIREPVEFPLYVSSTQLVVRPGDAVPVDPEQMTALPPIRTVLQAGKKAAASENVAVHLHAKLTEIGTLELWCSEVAGSKTWRLQFDVRAATRTDLTAQETIGERGGIVDQTILDACHGLIRQTFERPGDRPLFLLPVMLALFQMQHKKTGLSPSAHQQCQSHSNRKAS